jgi:hypothetical protein
VFLLKQKAGWNAIAPDLNEKQTRLQQAIKNNESCSNNLQVLNEQI